MKLWQSLFFCEGDQVIEDPLASLRKLAGLRAEYGRTNERFETIVPIYGETSAADLKRLVDAGATGTVSLPFPFTIGPASSLEARRAYLEGYAENVIARVDG